MMRIADEGEGARYNDYSNTKSDALLDIDQISSFQFSQEPFDIILEETQEKVRVDVLSDKILDASWMNRDEARPHTWKRNNQFLICDAEINSEECYKAVLMLACGYWRNQKINYTASDERRFHIRYRNGWDGIDSLYDTWLLNESKRREQSDFEAFIKKYLLWEDFHKQREGKRREKEIKETNEVDTDKRDPGYDTSSDKAYSIDTEDYFNANTS